MKVKIRPAADVLTTHKIMWWSKFYQSVEYVIHILARPSHSGDLGVGQYLVEN